MQSVKRWRFVSFHFVDSSVVFARYVRCITVWFLFHRHTYTTSEIQMNVHIESLSLDTNWMGFWEIAMVYIYIFFYLLLLCYFYLTNDKNQINWILLEKLILLTDEIPKIVNKNAIFWSLVSLEWVRSFLHLVGGLLFILHLTIERELSIARTHELEKSIPSIPIYPLNARLNCWSTTQFSIAISRIQFVLMRFLFLFYAFYLCPFFVGKISPFIRFIWFWYVWSAKQHIIVHILVGASPILLSVFSHASVHLVSRFIF